MEQVHIFLYRIKKSPLTMIGAMIVLLLLATAIFAPYIAPYNPVEINPPERLMPPSRSHICGTDTAGRDIFSRIVYGSRISIEIGVTVVFLAAVFGALIGIFSSYLGGMIDEIVMRITDVFLSVPYLILAMAIAAALGPSLINTLISLVIVWWPIYTRLTRGQVLLVRELTYVEASKGLGGRHFWIIFKHILPNSISPVIVQASLDFGNAIMSAAALSFIGLGAQPPSPEWGAMISEGRNYLRDSWWYATFPGLAIFITIMGFNLLGDGFRDILDPKLRERG
ncbi:MAG: ABC transporter permease subunit [Deltaproteobacteria bacterium]|nr:ABC transporter permease subunit [Deltaproteobacteria bacterium]